MKVKSQEDQKFWSLKFSDVMWKPAIDDEIMPENVIRPYQFEPEFSSSDEGVPEGEFDREQHDDENDGTRNLDWTVDGGRWTMDDGRWTMDSGLWTFQIGRASCRERV